MCGTSKVIGPKGPKAHNKIYINRAEINELRKEINLMLDDEEV